MNASRDPRKVSVVAVVAGVLVDIILTTLVQAGLVMAFGADAADAAAVERLSQSASFLGWALAIGAVCTGVGGFVTAWLANAARLAPGAGVRNALVMGIASAGSGLLLALATEGGPPVGYLALGTILTVPAAALGGFLYSRLSRETGSI